MNGLLVRPGLALVASLAAATTGLTLAGWVGVVTPAAAAGATYYATGATPVDGATCQSAAQACALQVAIDKTSDGDTVILLGGTYADTHVDVEDSLTLEAQAGQNPVLDGGGSGDVIEIGDESAPDVTIDGLTVRNGDENVYVDGGDATIENSTLDATQVLQADGAFCGGGASLTVDNTTISSADGSAGIYVADGEKPTVARGGTTGLTPEVLPTDAPTGCTDVTVTGSTFTAHDDVDYSSDGINNTGSTPVRVTGSQFTVTAGNGDEASGIDNEADGTVTVDSTQFTVAANSAPEATAPFAVGIHNAADEGTVIVTGSQFSAHATGPGKPDALGIENDYTGQVQVSGSTFGSATTAADSDNGSYAAGIVSCWGGCDPTEGPALSVDSSQFTMSTQATGEGSGGEADGIDSWDFGASVTGSTFTGTANGPDSDMAGIYSSNVFTKVAHSTFAVSKTDDSDYVAGIEADSAVFEPDLALRPAVVPNQPDRLITGSTFVPTGNSVGVVAEDSARVAMTDSTVAASGGLEGVAVYDSADVTVEQSTITGAEYGIDTDSEGASATLGADIIAGNGTDCDAGGGTVTDEGYNIDSDGSCGFSEPSVSDSADITGSLAPLADNGGPTKTVGLYAGSPARGMVDGQFTLSDGSPACANDDQRGVARDPEACDAGAFQGTVSRGPSGPVTQVAVTSSVPSSVFGEPVSFTATVSPAPSCGSVTWLVDGVSQGDAAPVASGKSVSGGVSFSLGPVSGLGVGSHPVTAEFSGCSGSPAQGTAIQVVGKGVTTTTLDVAGSTYTASVKPVAPAAGTPTGTVSFSVDGSPVGSAVLGADGTASFTASSAAHTAAEVSATYSGDDHFAASTSSGQGTSGKPPTIVAHVSSKHPKTKAGWYDGPVTVWFTCTAGGAPIADPPGCPGPVRLHRQGGGQSVTGTVTDTDGGTASVTVSPVNIDRSAPRHVYVSGVRDGATYSFAHRHRHLVCHARDRVSGVASCVVTKTHVTHKHFKVFTYTATATNNAGDSTTVTGSYRTHRKH